MSINNSDSERSTNVAFVHGRDLLEVETLSQYLIRHLIRRYGMIINSEDMKGDMDGRREIGSVRKSD